MRKVIFQNHFLEEAAARLQKGHSVRLRINGQSMHPFIVGGRDEVELVPYRKEEPLPLYSCLFYRWRDHYMIHRYIGKESGSYRMMGDGNLVQVEEVEEKDIFGILRTIYRSDGSIQNCTDNRWLRKGMYWYKFRYFRRFILPIYRKLLKG